MKQLDHQDGLCTSKHIENMPFFLEQPVTHLSDTLFSVE